jgi:hydrogenase maturation protease
VLSSLRALGVRLPRTRVLGCIPVTVDEGLGLSGPVAAAVGPAADRVRALLAEVTAPAGVGG